MCYEDRDDCESRDPKYLIRDDLRVSFQIMREKFNK